MGVKKIIQEEIQQTVLDGIIDLLEGVGDKYAQKFGVPDSGEEFDARYQQHLKSQEKPDASMGEKVTEFDTEKYVKTKSGTDYVNVVSKAGIYKNPKSLDRFASNVRAISTENGDLYIADIDGYFTHSEMSKHLFNESPYAIQKYVTWYRTLKTNDFRLASVSESKFRDLKKGIFPMHFSDRFWNGISKLEKNNPGFRFLEVTNPIQANEGVGDKYAEKSGVPDSGEEFEKRWQTHRQTQQKDVENGTLVGQVYSTEDYNDDYKDQPINVFKNPQTLKNFQPNVRAVGDREGNLYVAQIDGNFYHEDIIYIVPSIRKESEGVQLYRAKDSNWFGVAGTYLRKVFNTDDVTTAMSQEHIEDHPEIQASFVALNNKLPQFKFSYYPTYMLLGQLTQQQMDQSILKDPEPKPVGDKMKYFENLIREEIQMIDDGVADTYVEKRYGIPTQDTEFEKQYQRLKPKDDSMGELVGYTPVNFKGLTTPIYRNPKSLKNFEADVRAVSDGQNNLYVAQEDGLFTHQAFEVVVGSKVLYGNLFIQWERAGNANKFGFGDSFIYNPYREADDEEEMKRRVAALQSKHPNFEFVQQYYQNVGDREYTYEGVGDKYVEKKFHIPDEETEFEKRWQGQLQKNVEKPFKSNGKLDVYKNPSSLKHFDNSVRAIADENGDIYVAQQDLPFSHAELAQFIGFVKEYRDYWFMVEKLPALHRRGNTNTFGLSDSSVRNIKRNEDNRNKVRDIFSKVKQKNPEFDFTLKYYFDEGMAVGDNSGYMQMVDDGVGDKYAEKKWGIPDTDKQFMDKGIPDAPGMGERVADVWGSNWNSNEMKNGGPIYKNPTSLQGFDADVRAIGFDGGDLYVAQRNGDFIHVDMELAIEKVEGPVGEYYEFHRVGTKNEFGASDTLIHKIQDYALYMGDIIDELNDRHPQFEFSDKYYEYLRNTVNEKSDHRLMEIMEEEIQNVIKEIEPMEFKKSPQEIADNLVNDPYFERWKANYPETYEEPVLANVDVGLADKAFQRDDVYIAPDDKGIGMRRDGVMKTIEDGSLKYAPKVSIRMDAGQPVLSFDDGRHRFAVLRDLGVETINMTFSAGSQPHIHLLQKKMGLQEIISEEIQNSKQEILRQYIDVLKANPDDRHNLAIAYFIILHNFLNLERKFQADIDAAGKPLNKYLDVKPLSTPEEVYQKFLELYDVNSRVRFAVETFDSVESIRVFLQDHPEYYREVLN